MADVMVLGGYGAVGQHAARTLADAGMGVIVAGRRREPAERGRRRPRARRGGSGRRRRPRDGGRRRRAGRRGRRLLRTRVGRARRRRPGRRGTPGRRVGYRYQQAVAQRVGAACTQSPEALFSVGLTPGLTNLLAAEVAADAPDEPVEIVAVLGAGEEHGRAAPDWSYGLFGHRFPDTSGRGGWVRNFSGRQRRHIPGIGACWVYRVDISDQHVLSADLDRPVTTRLGTDSRPLTGLLAALAPIPGAARMLRTLEPAVPWSRLGSDRWVMAAGPPGRIRRWAAGRNEARDTGIVAGLATFAVLDTPAAGVTHLHQRTR